MTHKIGNVWIQNAWFKTPATTRICDRNMAKNKWMKKFWQNRFWAPKGESFTSFILGCWWDSLRHIYRCLHLTWEDGAGTTWIAQLTSKSLLSLRLLFFEFESLLSRTCSFHTTIVKVHKIQTKKWQKGLLFHSMIFAFFVKILMPDQ